MATVSQLGNVSGYNAKKPGALTAAGGVRAANLGSMNIYATMQGQRVLTEHLYTVAFITQPMLLAITRFFSTLMVEAAKYLHTENIDTGDTYRSIQRSAVTGHNGGAMVDVFVTTPQAKFLEFGFVHHLSGQWIFNPFMIPAADYIVPYYVDAITQVSGLLGSRKHLSGLAAGSGEASGILGSARAGLYSYSKYAGDIQVLGLSGLSKSRGFALKGAQGIGNFQAVQSGTAGSRALRVLTGRVGGKFGRAGVVSGFSGGSVLSGPSGRIYNRLGGRIFGNQLSGIKLPGF